MIKYFEMEKGPICPKCGSTNIGQLKEDYGPVWCNDCGYRIETKEMFNEFTDNGITRQLILEGLND